MRGGKGKRWLPCAKDEAWEEAAPDALARVLN